MYVDHETQESYFRGKTLKNLKYDGLFNKRYGYLKNLT